MTRLRILAFAAAAALAGAAPLAAQEPSMESGQRGPQIRPAAAFGRRITPGFALEQRDALGLSAQQVARLRALDERSRQAGRPQMARLQQAQQAVDDAWNRGDDAGFRAAVRRRNALEEEVELATFAVWRDAHAVLTPAQAARLQAIHAERQRYPGPGGPH
jgi:Spy/CpxP family protein refolding chaperone